MSEGHNERLAAIAEATGAFSDAVPDIEALLGIVAEHISRATGDGQLEVSSAAFFFVQ